MVWVIRTSQGFAEVLLVGVPLAAPCAIPERYRSRATSIRADVFHVHSSAFVEPPRLDRASIDKVGLWVIPADARPMGGLPSEGVSDAACVYGMPVQHSEAELQSTCAAVQHLTTRPSPQLVLYHGTSEHAWASIAREGLRATFGMLGVGVYLGSFWKATRFAARTQEYAMRSEGGCIARVYVHSGTIQNIPQRAAPEYACPCAECSEAQAAGGAALERSAHTDHETRWARDAACVGLHLSARRCASDPSLWILRNAEWCLRASCLSVQNAAALNLQSVSADRYDPLQRTQTIL